MLKYAKMHAMQKICRICTICCIYCIYMPHMQYMQYMSNMHPRIYCIFCIFLAYLLYEHRCIPQRHTPVVVKNMHYMTLLIQISNFLRGRCIYIRGRCICAIFGIFSLPERDLDVDRRTAVERFALLPAVNSEFCLCKA